LLVLVVLGTAALVAFGIDLLDGAVELRRLGHVDIVRTKVKFSAVVIGYLLSLGIVALGWLSLTGEWDQDYRIPLKAPMDDPDRCRRMS
jgi:hypothetical protein